MEKPQARGFLDLPNELILQVVSYLHPVRSYEPQAVAFRLKEKEKDRQWENYRRQEALYGLCLASHRLKALSEPVLYSAYIGSTNWRGLKSLRLFLRTVIEKPTVASRIEYIENRLSDFLGNGLYDDLEFYGAVEMVTEYFDILGAIILLTSNLVHLSVVSLETSEVSLWRHLVQDKDQPPRMATHGFPKLETLCLQIHSEDYGLGQGSTWFTRITNALFKVPTLQRLRVVGATSGSMNPLPGKYQSLHTVDISECILDFNDVVQIASACTKLKRFGCHWAYLNSQGFYLPDLYDALLPHRETLESLYLDTREVRLAAEDFPLQPLGALRDFTSIQSIELCETSLLANTMFLLDFPDQRLPNRLSELLPPSLESFTLLVKSEHGYNDDCRIDEAFALWDLAEDCPTVLPQLREIRIKSRYGLQAVNLVKQFRDIGVKFSLVKETEAPRYD